MKRWPNDVPHDLREALDQLAPYRDAPASSDIWAVLKEWFEQHDVEPTEMALQRVIKTMIREVTFLSRLQGLTLSLTGLSTSLVIQRAGRR